MSAQFEPAPGNFYSFEFFIEIRIKGDVHLGYPKICIRNAISGEVGWGSTLDWTWPDPEKLRMPWVDDEKNGFAKRRLRKPEDALGVEGSVGDMQLRFEKILGLREKRGRVCIVLP